MARYRFSALAIFLTIIPAWLQPYSATGQEPARPAAQAGPSEPIDMERARGYFRKKQQGEKLTPDEEAYLQRAMELRRRGNPGGQQGSITPRDSTGQKPLTEMTADDRYKGEDGGLYGGGQNTPPEAHRQAAQTALAQIKPLDSTGKRDAGGKIVFVSISMSNATQEFSRFKDIADADPAKSARLTIVDCAQGGQAMAQWVSPDARPWGVAMQRIASAGVSPEQVQVAWIKLANVAPRGSLEEHGRKLQTDTLAVIHNAKAKFPNLKIAYLGSRIYGGYGTGGLNPEPYAYEGAFPTRWLIQDQIKGNAALNYDPAKGDVKAPLLLWGPYLWSDGVKPRAGDQLVWVRDDFGGDGIHPTSSGRSKVGQMLLKFCKEDPLAKPWFVGEK